MLQLMSGFWLARAIYLAAKLGLADLMQAEPQTTAALAAATGTHAPALSRVLRALASAGIFAEDEQGRFTLTPLAATLQTNVPGSLRAWAMVQLGEEHYQAWGDLLYSVQTGESAFTHVFGTGVWPYRAQHPEHARLFDEAVAHVSSLHHATVLASYPFAKLTRVVDVGGGEGGLLVALLQAHPGMQGVLCELPHVAAKAQRRIAEAGLAERCAVVAGDVFTAVPGGGDAYVLARVLHTCDDDRAVALLTSCHRAMAPQSRLLLLERVLPARVHPSPTAQTVTLADLNLMVLSGGRERTAAEYRALCQAAHFELTQIIATPSGMSVIEGVRL
jgi:hypothetical protein